MTEQDNVLRLIGFLDQIEEDNEIKEIIPNSILSEEGGYYEEDLHPLIQIVIKLADSVLIKPDGTCNWVNIYRVREKYKVEAGEQDSFGRLTGIIKTSKGGIVYG
jgi:hypothetical protein